MFDINGLLKIEEQALGFYDVNMRMVEDEGVINIFKALLSYTKSNIATLKSISDPNTSFDISDQINLFTCLEDCGCANIKNDEMNIYVSGSDMERKLIGLYEEAKGKEKNSEVIEKIDSILKKHKESLFVLNDMIQLLTRPSEWVESAEFTLREPY